MHSGTDVKRELNTRVGRTAENLYILRYSCYCVDKYGQRIFGEALYAGGMAILMRCECAREEAKLRQMLRLESSNKFIRCNAWGAYERLQCLGDQCICVDHHTGSPASPVYNRTDLSDLQEDWKCC